jgi:hypothetical protein
LSEFLALLPVLNGAALSSPSLYVAHPFSNPAKISVDEFAIAQNTHYINATPKASQATMLQAIKGCPRKRCEKRSCITMPRLRFGNFEENNVSNKSNWSPHGFSDKYFLTLRWRWRSGLHNRKNNRNPKSMIDVSNIDESSFLRNNTDAHRPVRSVCPRRELYLLNRNSEFSVHHYIGTREQWDFRKDAREGAIMILWSFSEFVI